jgi:hypothetical protein
MMKRFPSEIFITRKHEGTDDAYLVVHESAREVAVVGKKIKAGRYALLDTVVITTETKVKTPKPW